MRRQLQHALRQAGALGLAMLLAGCGSLVGEKRHSPAEIAAYQPADFSAPIASAAGRDEAHGKARASIQRALMAPDDEPAMKSALWAVKFLNEQPDAGLALLRAALPRLASSDADFQRAVLSSAHAGYAAETAAEVLALLPAIATPREFAIGAYSVLRGQPDRRAELRALLQRQFPGELDEPRLLALRHALTVDRASELVSRPPLVDLVAAPFRAGKPVVFSFQRRDRRHFGLAVVRAADGRFVRGSDGSVFSIAQLALALTQLPGTLTNGNTPQGVFTIVGAGTATNAWIGPTPYLHAKVPVEATVAEFEHAAIDAEWNEARYEDFLPPSWRGYFPMKEAWLAGRAGRNEMLAHGTTISPDLYRHAKWYPGTPSAGCLVAMEYWAADGQLQKSDQLALAKAFTAGGIDHGYLVVVELDDAPRPVALADVLPDLVAAEGRLDAARR